MQPSFSPSINVVRDADQDLHYIPTLNAKRIYDQILSDFKVGIHSFNIIGSYGTGKSAFLLAMQRTLNGERSYFGTPNGQFNGANKFEYIPFVGAYSSVVDAFGLYFGASTEKEIFTALDKLYKKLSKKNCCLVIMIDEFGKFLEYAAKNNPEKELYFIQILAEYVNDPEKNILFLTTLHQGFFSYSQGLTMTQQEEWEKVKGRLKELTFNEPVEQLLELAANHLEASSSQASNASLKKLIASIEDSAAFPHRGKLSVAFAKRILPLDLISGSVITQALQRYGQNERSLFTFLNSTDFLGINQYDQSLHPYYNLVCVYDYLIYNFHSYLSSVRNSDYIQWRAVRTAIERVEAVVAENMTEALALVKVVGLLNIFAPAGASISKYFLTNYATHALGLQDPKEVLKELESRKILRYVNFKDSFVLFEGTDLNIDLAILEAADQVDPVQNVVPYLNTYFDFPLLLAKAVTYKYGTPRFFEFRLSDELISIEPEGITDGFINLVFSDSLTVEQLLILSTEQSATLFCLFQQTSQIRNILFELEKINYVLAVNSDDRVAERELQKLKTNQVDELNRSTMDSLYANDNSIAWVWQGEKIEIANVSAFNMQLSKICEVAYPAVPLFRNELVNRHKLSSAISSARSKFFNSLTEKWQIAELGYKQDKYPPDRTIYLTLLKQTEIHRQEEDGDFVLTAPTDPTFEPLWSTCMDFLNSSKQTPRSLSDLIDLLRSRPFKLKEGFIEFWVPTFLFINREDFAIYREGVFMASFENKNLELVRKEPHKFQIKAFNVDGIRLEFFNRCRALLKQKTTDTIQSDTIMETIRPFVTFYNELPAYAKETERVDKATIRLRQAIATAKDPEKTFFEDYPIALGYADLIESESIDEERIDAYTTQLQTSVHELQGAFDGLVDRVEAGLLDILGLPESVFPDYRDDIIKRFASLRIHMLTPKLKTLNMRLSSPLEERIAWLESIVQAVIGKNIRNMKDEDELIVYEKLREAIQALDNLCELDKLEIDPAKESPAVSVQITSSAQGTKRQIKRLPKQKEKKVDSLAKKLRQELGNDSAVNFAALTKLLEEVMDNE